MKDFFFIKKIYLEITQNLIARFFHTHYQCGLESIQLTTDQTMEYFLPSGMMLECPRSSLVHRYNNGTLVRQIIFIKKKLTIFFDLLTFFFFYSGHIIR